MLLLLLLPQDVDLLVERLGSPAYEERKRALEEVVRVGRKAVPALEAAARSADPEVQLRAREALDRIRSGGLFDARGAADPATEAALAWLARHQAADGSWSGRFDCCPGKGPSTSDAGLTGLATLAFLTAGRRPASCEPLRKGLERLAAWQDQDGRVGPRGAKMMYGHAIGALALAEGYGFGESEALKGAAQKAADYTAAARNPGRAWRYAPRGGDNDTSVTFWATLSLAVGRRVGLEIPREAFAGARSWLDEVTDEAYGRVGYVTRYTKCVSLAPAAEFDAHETRTGGALFLRRLFGQAADEPPLRNALHMLQRDPPSSLPESADYCYWHLASLGMFHADGVEGKAWRAWEKELRTSLLPSRRTAGCADGSWDPADAWSPEGGRAYATALNALTLETSRRYRSVGGIARPR